MALKQCDLKKTKNTFTQVWCCTIIWDKLINIRKPEYCISTLYNKLLLYLRLRKNQALAVWNIGGLVPGLWGPVLSASRRAAPGEMCTVMLPWWKMDSGLYGKKLGPIRLSFLSLYTDLAEPENRFQDLNNKADWEIKPRNIVEFVELVQEQIGFTWRFLKFSQKSRDVFKFSLPPR